MSPRPIGIDLGTTHSSIAVLGSEGPQLLRNVHGEVLTPSIVHLDEKGRMLVGRGAGERASLSAGRTARQFKRNMGTEKEYLLGEVFHTPQLLSSWVLRSLKADAESLLSEEIHKVVITVPAWFHDQQRQATVDAAEFAGLQVARIVNEPTAAALAYGLHRDEEARTCLVFDLGGGTFDVTLLDMEEGLIEVRASAGEAFLGGEDFTDALLDSLLEPHGTTAAELEQRLPRLHDRLRRRVEEAKRRLSEVESTTVPMPDLSQEEWVPKDRVEVTREGFELACQTLLHKIRPILRRMLSDADCAREDLDEILLVGGATRMPCIPRMLEKLFGQTPKADLDPDLVVAMGAAVQAGLIEDDEAVQDLVVTDVMPHSLGIEVSKEFGSRHREGYYLPIIHRNTTIPTSRTEVVQTLAHMQSCVEVQIYQGEGRFVRDNLLLGKLEVKGIPQKPAGQESVGIRFTYDLNGLLQVEATILSIDKTVSAVLEQRPGRLSEAEKKKALIAMERLKIEPREEAANRHLLDMGARLFAEIHETQRPRLDETLTAFEEALESRDTERIQRIREELSILLSYLQGEDPLGQEPPLG